MATTIAEVIKKGREEAYGWSGFVVGAVVLAVATVVLSPWAIKYARRKRRLDKQIQAGADEAERAVGSISAETDVVDGSVAPK